MEDSQDAARPLRGGGHLCGRQPRGEPSFASPSSRPPGAGDTCPILYFPSSWAGVIQGFLLPVLTLTFPLKFCAYGCS